MQQLTETNASRFDRLKPTSATTSLKNEVRANQKKSKKSCSKRVVMKTTTALTACYTRYARLSVIVVTLCNCMYAMDPFRMSPVLRCCGCRVYENISRL